MENTHRATDEHLPGQVVVAIGTPHSRLSLHPLVVDDMLLVLQGMLRQTPKILTPCSHPYVYTARCKLRDGTHAGLWPIGPAKAGKKQVMVGAIDIRSYPSWSTIPYSVRYS